MNATAQFLEAVRRHRGSIAAFALCMTLVSAVWIENDAYRLGAPVLVAWGLCIYFFSKPRVSIGWMGVLCVAWILFVAFRYIQAYAANPSSTGASEGIYLLPAFYITTGYMLFLFRRLFAPGIIFFHAVSIVMAIATVDFFTALNGEHHEFLLMNNTIHSSVGGGLIVLASINFAAYLNRTVEPAWKRILLCWLLYVNIAIYFIGIFGAQSKGVWISLAIAVLLQVLVSARHHVSSGRIASAVIAGFAFLLVTWALRDEIWATVGPSYDSLASLLIKAFTTGHPIAALREAIASGSVPENVNIRLMLWYNCLEVIDNSIVFGNGIGWLAMYKSAHYQNVGFDIVHNGYLEIAMRYGLLGLAFYAVLYGWTIVMVWRAQRKGLIPVEAWHFHVVALAFFFASIATNSNNRIAIGESFMLVSAAFGFCCFFLLQTQQRHEAMPAPLDGAEVSPAA